MDLVAVLKAEYEQAQRLYLARWSVYDSECVFKNNCYLTFPRSPNSTDGSESCREIARAGKAMDVARAKYEAAHKLADSLVVLTAIITAPAQSPVLTPKQVDENATALVAKFAGQTVDRATISRQFGRDEAVTRRALFEAWSAGKALYDGKAFKFMGAVAV